MQRVKILYESLKITTKCAKHLVITVLHTIFQKVFTKHLQHNRYIQI